MASCGLELCNPQIGRPTSRALDWMVFSSLPVMLWMLWCTMGCNVAHVPLCVVRCWGGTISGASQLVCLYPHVNNNVAAFARLEALWCLRTQSSTSGVRESKISAKAHPPWTTVGMIAILHRHAPIAFLVHSRGHQACAARNGAWRTQIGSICSSARTVRNARTTFHRVVRSRIGKRTLGLCRACTHEPQLPESGRCSALSQDVITLATVGISRTFPDRHCGAVAATCRLSPIFECFRP